jgi:hypothetical protein
LRFSGLVFSLGVSGRRTAGAQVKVSEVFAVRLKIAGADDMGRCGTLGHSTIQDIDQQFVPPSQQRAVDKLSSLGTSIK